MPQALPQFQSLVQGYNYTFSSNFEESGPLSTGGIGLTDRGFAFELYSGPVNPGKAVKVVEVLEDPALAKILNVTSYSAGYNPGGPIIPAAAPINPSGYNPQNNTLLSPLKQFKSGIAANNVTCKQDLQLVIKSKDNFPACVKDTSIGRLVRQGWWAWNNKVGDTIVNTPNKKDFDSKSCVISETTSSIVGTGGFGRDDLPSSGITYPGVNLTRLVDESIQFAIRPNSSAQIVFTYDFNPYPGSNCKVTTKDAMAYINMARSNTLISNTTRSNTPISDFQSSPDIFEVDKTKIRTDLPLLGDSGDVQVKLINAEDLNDHVVKVTYQITSKPTSQIGKSYLLSFWWHSAIGVTVGNDLYNGTAFSGPRFG